MYPQRKKILMHNATTCDNKTYLAARLQNLADKIASANCSFHSECQLDWYYATKFEAAMDEFEAWVQQQMVVPHYQPNDPNPPYPNGSSQNPIVVTDSDSENVSNMTD